MHAAVACRCRIARIEACDTYIGRTRSQDTIESSRVAQSFVDADQKVDSIGQVLGEYGADSALNGRSKDGLQHHGCLRLFLATVCPACLLFQKEIFDDQAKHVQSPSIDI